MALTLRCFNTDGVQIIEQRYVKLSFARRNAISFCYHNPVGTRAELSIDDSTEPPMIWDTVIDPKGVTKAKRRW